VAAPSPEELRREFLLDPEVAFLNHGSFGACPRPVFERYQAWQRELEREPIDFLDRRLPALLDDARGTLAAYVGCSADDLAFVQNATTGVNLAARSFPLGPNEEVLATDLEYGACDLAWEWACRRAGARYVRAPIPLPLREPSEVAEALFAHATERTRAVYVSHVTSTTGLLLPLEEIIARARALDLVTIVDGAHAPAQVPVDLAALGADCYAGNAHKWLCAPKGAGFLHIRPEHQDRVDSAIVSWGYSEGNAFSQRIEKQARSRGLAHGPRRDPVPRRARLGRDRRPQPKSRARRPPLPLRPAGNGAPGPGLDGRADGDCPAPPPLARALAAPLRAPPRRDPGRRPREGSPATVRRRLHDRRRDRPPASRPRSGA
jgi:selenocysteine lyase/cysteine desulfurase